MPGFGEVRFNDFKTVLKLFYARASSRLAVCRWRQQRMEPVRIKDPIRGNCVLTLVAPGAALAGAAQYQDRDTRGVPGTSASAPPPRRASTSITPPLNELLKVPGMTPSWAGRIVRFRPYRSKADLLDRGIVTIAGLRPHQGLRDRSSRQAMNCALCLRRLFRCPCLRASAACSESRRARE